MRGYCRSRTFWLIFLSAFVTMLGVAMGIFLYTWQTNARKELEAARKENQESVEAIVNYLDGLFRDMTVMTNAVNSTEWVRKLCADSEVFYEEFEYVRQRQIASDYLFYVSAEDVVSRRFMAFPYIDLCIGWKVWADSDAYFGALGVAQEDRITLMESIRQAGMTPAVLQSLGTSELLICFPAEDVRAPRAYMCFCVDMEILRGRIRQLMSPGVVGIRMRCETDDQVLLEEGMCNDEETIQMNAFQSVYLDWNYELFVDASIASIEYTARDMHIIRYAAILTLMCAMLGYGVAAVLYRPVKQLVKRAGIRQQEKQWKVSDYEMLSKHIDYMNEQYRQGKRAAFMHQLLNGFFVQDEKQLHSVGLPFNEKDFFRVFICADKETGSDEMRHAEMRRRLEQFLDERGLTCELLDTIDSELILVISCASEEEAENLPRQALRELLIEEYDVYWGGASQGLIGVSLSYQAAIEKRRRMAGLKFSRFYLPMEWENQWMDALLNGKLEMAERIGQEIRWENDRRLSDGRQSQRDYDRMLSALISDLTRVVEESNLRAADTLADLIDVFEQGESEQIWAGIQNLCMELCARETEEEGASGDVSREIARYIDENYGNSDLSLTMLSDFFGLSVNTINKCLRQTCGMTFHVYLTQRRIERAKELLSTREYRIGEVAEMVGYDTEYSFRRAFHRYTGVKAQAYE